MYGKLGSGRAGYLCQKTDAPWWPLRRFREPAQTGARLRRARVVSCPYIRPRGSGVRGCRKCGTRTHREQAPHRAGGTLPGQNGHL